MVRYGRRAAARGGNGRLAGWGGVGRQVDQLETARFDVRVVASADCDRPATGRRISAALVALFGAATTANVAFVDRLERTSWGKLRPIRSFRPGR